MGLTLDHCSAALAERYGLGSTHMRRGEDALAHVDRPQHLRGCALMVDT